MAVPKYVGQWFSTGIKTPKNKVLKRLKLLEDSRFGYATKEYKDLKRYDRVLKEQSFSKAKYYRRNKKKKK